MKTIFREEVCILFEKPNNLACQKKHSYQIKTNWSRTRAYLQNMVKTHFYKKNILAENLLKEDVTYLLLLPTHYPSTILYINHGNARLSRVFEEKKTVE